MRLKFNSTNTLYKYIYTNVETNIMELILFYLIRLLLILFVAIYLINFSLFIYFFSDTYNFDLL